MGDMSFAERIRQHDENAYPLVRDALARYGFALHCFGIELNLELQKILQKQTDKTSKMLRYRPDFIAVCPGKKSILLEIKSENKNSPNFSIEYDAWDAAKIWNKHTKNVLYLFVDLAENNILNNNLGKIIKRLCLTQTPGGQNPGMSQEYPVCFPCF